MRRLLAIAALAAAAFPVAAHADSVACVRTVPDGLGAPLSYCVPVYDEGVPAHCHAFYFATPFVPDVYVCSTAL